MIRFEVGVVLISLVISAAAANEILPNANVEGNGTQWAVLVAGSNGYWNYRHQADVCHAYQILKKGGLKDENIIVFMYDDIAHDPENPRPGVIINSPNGTDVYKGVPKDYTGEDVNAHNFYAVILGNKTDVKGGSGKVVNSGPNDRIFIFYTDHGGPGSLCMPSDCDVYANDLVDVLKKKHASGTYKSMVFYLEACEAGSMFEGLLPDGLNIYATTASNAEESSWGYYCPDMKPEPPAEYTTCLGDLYSISWMEDCDVQNLQAETFQQQYEIVKKRTAGDNYTIGSHVMQYGDLKMTTENLSTYLGENPSNKSSVSPQSVQPPLNAVNQRDADLLHFWDKFRKAPEGSKKKAEAQRQILEAMSRRTYIDNSVDMVGKLLFGIKHSDAVLSTVRPSGKPIVDNWDCLKSLVKTFEKHCGSLSEYGVKHMRSFANLCNAGTTEDEMDQVAELACSRIPRFT